MESPSRTWSLRLACVGDADELATLIPLSVRSLQKEFYSPAQMEAAIGPVFGVDYQLIGDGTYFVVEGMEGEGRQLIACGGWSRREALYGGSLPDAKPGRLLNPKTEPARVRAFFVHPEWARQGIGRAILRASEAAAQEAGFVRAELCATLAGEPLYAARGWHALRRYSISLGEGMELPVVEMAKDLGGGGSGEIKA